MDYELYKLQLARDKVSSIATRFVIAFVLNLFTNGNTIMFFGVYALISWYWIFVKITRNWILGAVIGIITVFLIVSKIERTGSATGMNAFMIFMFFGLAVIDLINVIRYFKLKSDIQKQNIQIRNLSREEMRNFRNMQ